MSGITPEKMNSDFIESNSYHCVSSTEVDLEEEIRRQRTERLKATGQLV
jgi:hypothetical protein